MVSSLKSYFEQMFSFIRYSTTHILGTLLSVMFAFFCSFIGEESVAAGAASILTDNPTWIIDPIDGTTNFVHRWGRNDFKISLKNSSVRKTLQAKHGHFYVWVFCIAAHAIVTTIQQPFR